MHRRSVFLVDEHLCASTMTSSLPNSLQRTLGKLPVVSDVRKDRKRKALQNELLSAHITDAYLEPEPTVGEYVKSILPTGSDALHYVANTFPCHKWFFRYNLRWFLGDLIAGKSTRPVLSRCTL
jgi:hypothetical protein